MSCVRTTSIHLTARGRTVMTVNFLRRRTSTTIRALGIGIAITFAYLNACAATFSWPTPTALRMSGQIVEGDVDRFVRAIRDQTKRGSERLLYTVELDSPGGSVQEAVKLAELLDILFIDTVVPKGSVCASSCFFLFLSGNTRYAEGFRALTTDPSPTLGHLAVHRPFIAAQAERPSQFHSTGQQQSELMTITRSYLTTRQVPQYLIERMMQQPSNESYILSAEDIQEIGKYKPAFEELLVSKCSYRKSLDQEYSNQPTSGDQHRILLEHDERIHNCWRDRIMEPYMDNERPLVIKKLNAGWRPWHVERGQSRKPAR